MSALQFKHTPIDDLDQKQGNLSEVDVPVFEWQFQEPSAEDKMLKLAMISKGLDIRTLIQHDNKTVCDIVRDIAIAKLETIPYEDRKIKLTTDDLRLIKNVKLSEIDEKVQSSFQYIQNDILKSNFESPEMRQHLIFSTIMSAIDEAAYFSDKIAKQNPTFQKGFKYSNFDIPIYSATDYANVYGLVYDQIATEKVKVNDKKQHI